MFTASYQKGINEGRLDLCTLSRALSETPAKIFGLYPQKGTIAQGSDADLVIFDPTRKHTITQTNQHSNAPYTLYEGWECMGAPDLVIQKGSVIVDGQEFKAQKGEAQHLPVKITDVEII